MRGGNGKRAWNPEDPFDCTTSTNECCMHCWNGAGGCEWADSLEPVPGWVADKVETSAAGKIKSANEAFSYKIHYCPKYVEGDKLSGKRIQHTATGNH